MRSGRLGAIGATCKVNLVLLVREAGRECEVGRLSDLADFLAGRESLGRNAGDDDGNDNSGDHVVSFACLLEEPLGSVDYEFAAAAQKLRVHLGIFGAPSELTGPVSSAGWRVGMRS